MAHAAHSLVGGAPATEHATATATILASRPELPILGIFGGGAAALHGPRACLLHGPFLWIRCPRGNFGHAMSDHFAQLQTCADRVSMWMSDFASCMQPRLLCCSPNSRSSPWNLDAAPSPCWGRLQLRCKLCGRSPTFFKQRTNTSMNTTSRIHSSCWPATRTLFSNSNMTPGLPL